MQYFTFCQSDLVLEKTADGYAIPQEPPTETKPWTTVMNVDTLSAAFKGSELLKSISFCPGPAS